MSEQLASWVVELFAVSDNHGLPGNVQSLINTNVATSREALLQINSIAKDRAKSFEDAMMAGYAGVKTIAEKVLLLSEANARAVFDAAQSIAHAKSPIEAANLQSKYWQKQLIAIGVQTKELYELSAKVRQQTFERMTAAAYDHAMVPADTAKVSGAVDGKASLTD